MVLKRASRSLPRAQNETLSLKIKQPDRVAHIYEVTSLFEVVMVTVYLERTPLISYKHGHVDVL